jgi:hypothetical protein
MSPQTTEQEKLQRLINLAAQMENFNTKIGHGMQPSVAEYDRLSDNQREFAELLGEYNLHPPVK